MITQRLSLRSRLPRLVALFSIVVLFVLLLPYSAEAHAQYDHSDPPANARLASGQMPARVQVWFTEHIDPNFSRLIVYNAQRQQVNLNDSKTSADHLSM